MSLRKIHVQRILIVSPIEVPVRYRGEVDEIEHTRILHQ